MKVEREKRLFVAETRNAYLCCICIKSECFCKKDICEIICVCVSVCFFFPFPASSTYTQETLRGKKKTEKLTFFHPAIFHSRI